MCGRFFIPEMDDSPEELLTLITELEQRLRVHTPDFRLKRGEICPGDAAAVIAPSRTRKPRAFVMKWGYHLHKQLVFNARSETAAAKPLFAQSMQDRRCLVPATAYFEWNRNVAGKPKYRFAPTQGEMFFMAGLYRLEEERQPVFTILTREACGALRDIHDRMPVIVPAHLAKAWLDGSASPEELLSQAVEDLHFSLAP